MPVRIVNSQPFQSIVTALIRKTFLVATACALLVSGIQAWIGFRHEQAAFEQALREIAQTHVPLLSVLIWDIEPDAVRRQVRSIAARPQIGYVRLAAGTGQVFEAGSPDAARGGALERFNIPYPQSEAGSVGTLEIAANRATLYANVLNFVGIAVLGYGLLTVLICFVTAWILRRDLHQPLTEIAGFVGKLTPERLTEPLTVTRSGAQYRDEIDAVVDGFRTLQDGIDRHISNLDHLVEDRTRQLGAALEEIRQLSITDPMTQCYNRRLFDERIVQEIDRAERYQRPLSLIFCDIDHFKSINDTLGHNAGDEVLRGVAGCYRAGLRAGIDWVARYGGEEFVIVLPETPLEAGVGTAERLRGEIAAASFTGEGKTVRVTSSFGVAQYHPEDSVESLVCRADKALYLAKSSGRNCVKDESSARNAAA